MSATVSARPTRLTPTASWPKPVQKSVPFSGLLLFTIVLFAAPQHIIPALEPLKLAKLAVAFSLVPYLINRAMTSRPLTVVTPTVKWAGVLGVIGLVSMPFGYWPGGSIEVLTDLFGKSLVIFLLVANVVDTERRFRAIVVTMIGCSAFAAVWALANYAAGRFDPSGMRVAGYDSGILANPNDLALTMNIVLGLSLGLLPVLRKRTHRILLIGAMGLLVAGIIVSFSRSGFITLGALGAMWILRMVRQRGARAVPIVLLVVVVVVAMLPEGYGDRLSTIVDTEEDTTGSADERWQTMVTAVGQISEAPILGYGLGNNIHVSVARGGLPREAHNAYLKLGAELGVPAIVVYVLFIWTAFATARAVRRFFEDREAGWELGRLAGGVELSIVAFAVGALFSPVPYHFYFYFPAGLAVAIFVIGARVPASHAGRRR